MGKLELKLKQVGLLQTSLFTERENLVIGRQFLVSAGQEAVDLGPVNRVWLEDTSAI
jgi:hypothetical protein